MDFYLEDTIKSTIIDSEDIFKNKIFVTYTIELTELETKIFEYAIGLVANKLKQEGIKNSDLRKVNIFFIPYWKYTINAKSTSENDFNYGTHFKVITYSVNAWREKMITDDLLLIIMLEELCHCFWNIDDEYLVKLKIQEVIRQDLPNFDISKNIDMEEVKKMR